MKHHPLLDAVKEHLGVRYDNELAHQLGYKRQTIEKIRNGSDPITAGLEIAILEATNWTLWEMRGKARSV